jgi:hypothetical protein
MTIQEAIATNTLLTFIIGDSHPGPRAPTTADVLHAGELLAKHADKTLNSGITETDWRRKWKRKVTP